jgi:hypothetical protein
MTTAVETDDDFDSKKVCKFFVKEEKSEREKRRIIRSVKAILAWDKAKQETYKLSDRIDLVKFGVELECFFPSEKFSQLGLEVGTYHSGQRCPRTVDPHQIGWKCESDGSLQNAFPPASEGTFVACEFVSPPLKGLEGFNEIYRFVKLLQDNNVQVTRACGVHVNVGLEGVTAGQTVHHARCRKFVRRLMHFVSQHENGMMQIGGRRSRVNNYYCSSIKDIDENYALFLQDNVREFLTLVNSYGRYRTVNLSHLNCRKPRFEFRIFAGTVNPVKVIGYVAVALGLVHKAAEAVYAPQRKEGGWQLPNVVDDSKATLRLQVALWTRHKEWKYGLPAGVWEKWGREILKNQRWNARSFREGNRRNARAANRE